MHWKGTVYGFLASCGMAKAALGRVKDGSRKKKYKRNAKEMQLAGSSKMAAGHILNRTRESKMEISVKSFLRFIRYKRQLRSFSDLSVRSAGRICHEPSRRGAPKDSKRLWLG
jgi:hypothetical protein